MKKDEPYQHPMLVNAQKIKDNGIVVLDNIRGLPTGEEPLCSPDYVICIGHRGNMQLLYDNMPDHSSKLTVAVVFPNHTLRMVSKSDDYLATLVVVDAALLDDPLLRIINQMRYRYEPHPWVELDRREYGVIMHMVGVMRETASIDIHNRQHFMMSQLEFFMRLLSHYRSVKLNETPVEKRVSTLFSNNLAQYFRESVPHTQAFQHCCQAGDGAHSRLVDTTSGRRRSQETVEHAPRPQHTEHLRSAGFP